MCLRFLPVFYCKTGNAARLMCVLFSLLCSLCRFLYFSLQSARPRGLRQLMQALSALARGQGCVRCASLFLPYFSSIPRCLTGVFYFRRIPPILRMPPERHLAKRFGLNFSGCPSPNALAHHSEQNHRCVAWRIGNTTPNAPR